MRRRPGSLDTAPRNCLLSSGMVVRTVYDKLLPTSDILMDLLYWNQPLLIFCLTTRQGIADTVLTRPYQFSRLQISRCCALVMSFLA